MDKKTVIIVGLAMVLFYLLYRAKPQTISQEIQTDLAKKKKTWLTTDHEEFTNWKKLAMLIDKNKYQNALTIDVDVLTQELQVKLTDWEETFRRLWKEKEQQLASFTEVNEENNGSD